MFGTLFRKHCCNICCAFGAGRDNKDMLLSLKCPSKKCLQAKKTMTPLSYWWKKAQNLPIKKLYGNHVIWLLRVRRSCEMDGDKRVTVTVIGTVTEIASFES